MKVEWTWQGLLLRHPFTIARRTEVEKQTLVVRVDQDGIAGFGEAVPTEYYHQPPDVVEKALMAARTLLAGQDARAHEAAYARLAGVMPWQTVALSALDAALLDWAGKAQGIALWRLLGVDASAMPPTSFTIGIDTVEVVARKVQEAAGWPILKIKVDGRNALEMLEEVCRHHAGTVRVDANCAWTPERAGELLPALGQFPLDLLEQPLDPHYDHVMSRVRAGARGLPVVADESCRMLQDLPAAVGRFDGINIKLVKCGGIRSALAMIRLARALGLRVMLGCMIESSLGIAAAAAIAPLVDFVDLDGHLLLKSDPWRGLGATDGRLVLPDRPGLGVEPAA